MTTQRNSASSVAIAIAPGRANFRILMSCATAGLPFSVGALPCCSAIGRERVTEGVYRLAGFGRRLAEMSLAAGRFRNRRCDFRPAEVGAAIFCRRQPGIGLERPVERPDRAESGI